LKILMVLNGLEIGGAETHVVELSLLLKSRGYEIEVASNGGVYEAELEKQGIVHHACPLNSTSISCMKKSYKRLKQIIKRGKYDLVHAHARIPGFLCGILQKKLNFRLITTAHWVFRTGPLLNRLTNWGEYSVAVSDDIKKYLIDNYGMPANKISVTVNGINMEKFSPSVVAEEIYEEFSLDSKAKTIVYISRMDTDRSLVAHHLIAVADKLEEAYPGMQIVIVGGGDDYENILHEANAKNSEVGRRMIVTTGARTDIYKFVSIADLFVGVSRAALEAMSAAKPVIIAGNEGYIGAFHAGVLDEAIATNFCCRGCEPSTPEKLLEDIKAIFEIPKEQIVHLQKYNRKVIADNYSIDKMTDDYEEAYKKLLATDPFKNNDIIISGYYGYRNIGDDSLLQAIISNLRDIDPDVRIIALSKTPKETEEKYNIKSINRFNFIKIKNAISRSKLLISGGGSLIQDVTSTRSFMYYLNIISMALNSGIKTFVYANGIGPIINEKNRIKAKEVLNQVDLITIRDENSLGELENMGVDNPNCILTADPAYSILPADGELGNLLSENGIDKDEKYFMISLREWDKNAEDIEDVIVRFCEYINARYDYTPVFVPMHKKFDFGICSRIRRRLNFKTVLIKKKISAAQLMILAEKSEFIIGMRLHLLIYSLSVGTPIIALSYDPKVDSVLKSHTKNISFDVEELDAKKLTQAADFIIENRAQIAENNLAVSETLSASAYEDAKRAIDML